MIRQFIRTQLPRLPSAILPFPLGMKRKLRNISDGYQVRTMRSIQLNQRETALRDLLLDVAAFIDRADNRKDAEPLVLRWAGGWVRDKLLGIESHDIDTAINSMTGFPFAEKMREFCLVPEHARKHNIGSDDIGHLHKVAANPDKSKHLETATVKIFSIEVDFVNLRKETYADDSRNPQVEFGTPEEDALRRDATVNALFYNLNTGEVEDFTSGLPDLEDKLIRTPLEPLQTFMDDPLRVLRLVRFASRLQFTLDPAAKQIMGDSKVLEALALKISRERVGVEIEKMLKGKYPRDSLRLIDQCGLYHAVFSDPALPSLPEPDVSNWSMTYECVEHLSRTQSPGSIYDILVRTEEARYFLWVLAAVAPWEQVKDPRPPKPITKQLPLPAQAAREGIKAPNKLCDVITAAHRHRHDIVQLKEAVWDDEPHVRERDRIGMAIRDWDSRGGQWRLQVFYAILVEMIGLKAAADRDKLLEPWQKLLDHFGDMEIMDAPHVKRLIDGRQLASAIGVAPGKWMTKAMDITMAWQLRNPHETDPAGAVEEVRQRKKDLGIPEKAK